MKRLACLLPLAVVAADCARPAATTCPNAPTSANSWADPGSTRRRFVRLNPVGSDVLDDVPLLVRLDPVRVDYRPFAERGADIKFVDATGATLAHEIDSWKPRGVSAIWVRVPKLDPGKAGGFWMYYGGSAAAHAG